MDYVRLGYTGLKVSRLCLGAMTYGTSKWRAWVLDEADSRPFIARALDHGITFFDTADMYSEGAPEHALALALALHGGRLEERDADVARRRGPGRLVDEIVWPPHRTRPASSPRGPPL